MTAEYPLLHGIPIAASQLAGGPFLVAGGLKIVYDLLLWQAFRAHRPPEES